MVASGICTCKAGQSGACAHIGALLLTVVKTREACTSPSCQWKGPAGNPMKLEPARACDIHVYNPEKDKGTQATQKPYPGVYQTSPMVNSESFLQDLLNGMETLNQEQESCLYQTLRSKVMDLTHFLKAFERDLSYCDLTDLCDRDVQEKFDRFVVNMKMTVEAAKEVEICTRGQGVNPTWREARAHLITASVMGEVCKRRKPEPDGLVKRIMYPNIPQGVKSLAYGHKMEPKARRQYAMRHILECRGAEVHVDDQGLNVSTDHPYLGASVDGLVHCTKCGDGIVEIKCPYGKATHKYRSMPPAACATQSDFCCEVQDEKLHLKTSHSYYYQIQGQMAVCCLEWVDFVIWTKKGMSVERIPRDRDFWATMLPKLRAFYVRGIVAELFTQRIKRGKSLYPQETEK